jgi:1,4-dihydroxy-2-naphthoate octaprenyltransferase
LKAGKKTLVTRIGRKRATDVYCVLMAGTYLAVVLGVVSSLMPSFTLLSFLTAPLALRAMLVARRNYEAPQRLIPANAGTVMVHLLTGLILIGTYVIGGIAGL